jgi:EpsI family protein
MKLYLKAFAVLVAVLCGLTFFRVAMPEAYRIDEEMSPVYLNFPQQLGNWTGKNVDVEEKVYEILETRNVLSRDYVDPQGNKIHLLLVISNKDRRVAHPPEVCYLGSHYTITDEKQTSMSLDGESISVKEFIAQSEKDSKYREYVWYVYKIGDQYTTNYYSQQLKFAFDQLANQSTDIILIRLAGSNRDAFEGFLKGVLSSLK